jgi:hypothetical protein
MATDVMRSARAGLDKFSFLPGEKNKFFPLANRISRILECFQEALRAANDFAGDLP